MACAHMVARESFGSAVFDDEDGGSGAAYGNSKEEQDDIEEELQVSLLSWQFIMFKQLVVSIALSKQMHMTFRNASIVRTLTSATVDYSTS